MPQNASAAERVSSVRTSRSRSDFDPDLAWLLECGGAALGERGTLASVLSVLERGGGDSMPNTDPYTDAHLGWGKYVVSDVEKHRWLLAAWNALTAHTQRVLLARYMPPPAEFRSDEGYGAKHKWVKGTAPYGPPPTKEFGRKGQQIRVKRYQARLRRWESAREDVVKVARTTGVESLLGVFAMLAFAIASDPVELLLACRQPNSTSMRKIRRDALGAARAANLAAHYEWFESKGGADPVRTAAQRGSVSPR